MSFLGAPVSPPSMLASLGQAPSTWPSNTLTPRARLPREVTSTSCHLSITGLLFPKCCTINWFLCTKAFIFSNFIGF